MLPLLDAITKWSRFSLTVKPNNQYVEDDIFKIEFLNLISKYMILESCENPLPQLVEIESYGKSKWKVIQIRCYSLWKLKVMKMTRCTTR